MNIYAFLPLTAFIANIFLGFYILWKKPKDKLSRLYSLVTFSWAVWAFGDFLVFTSQTPELALQYNIFASVGAALNPIFALHFFLKFTEHRPLSRKLFYVLYLPSLIFIFLAFTTDLT